MHDDQDETAGLSRRDLLKRSVVVGGLAWVAPTVLAAPAGATVVNCPAAQRYAIKHNNVSTGAGPCEVPGKNPSTGNCAASDGTTEFQSGCCLEPGLVQFASSAGGTVHTYTLAPGVGFSRAYAKCGNVCHPHVDPHNEFVTEEQDPATGITTVVMSCANLSHSELVVCLSGSNLPVCP